MRRELSMSLTSVETKYEHIVLDEKDVPNFSRYKHEGNRAYT